MPPSTTATILSLLIYYAILIQYVSAAPVPSTFRVSKARFRAGKAGDDNNLKASWINIGTRSYQDQRKEIDEGDFAQDPVDPMDVVWKAGLKDSENIAQMVAAVEDGERDSDDTELIPLGPMYYYIEP